jgi:hypothetical protein
LNLVDVDGLVAASGVLAADVISAASLALSAWTSLSSDRARIWQRERDEASRETRLQIGFLHSSAAERGPFVLIASGPPLPPTPILYNLTLLVATVGETTESISGAFLEQAREPGQRHGLRIFGNEGHEPFESHELRPRVRLPVPVELEPGTVAWMQDGFAAEVSLASGARIRSDVEQLDAEHLGALT